MLWSAFVRPRTRHLIGLHDRLMGGSQRQPGNPAALLHQLLNRVGDGLLALHQPMSDKLTKLQKRLLDPSDPWGFWLLLGGMSALGVALTLWFRMRCRS